MRSIPTIVATLWVAGCAALVAGDRLETQAGRARGRLHLVAADALGETAPAADGPAAAGTALLRDAVTADAGIAAFVQSHGVPDAIGVERHARAVHLAYARDDTLVTLEHQGSILIPRGFHESDVVATRVLTETERRLLDPERRRVASTARLATDIAAYARLREVTRRVVLALPAMPAGTPGWSPGFSVVRADAVSMGLFGEAPSQAGVFVAHVEADGPAAGWLVPGDWIATPDGLATLARRPGDPLAVTVVRGGETARVVVAPERWPLALDVVVVAAEDPNAFAVDRMLGVSTALLRLAERDDELAAIVGHEVAHLTLGHVVDGPTPGRVLQGMATIGVLLPVDLVVPGAGQVLGGLLQGVRNRFNRAQERAADREGVRYAAAAGYDPAAALVILARLEAFAPSGRMSALLDVHPPYPERVEAIRAAIAALPAG